MRSIVAVMVCVLAVASSAAPGVAEDGVTLRITTGDRGPRHCFIRPGGRSIITVRCDPEPRDSGEARGTPALWLEMAAEGVSDSVRVAPTVILAEGHHDDPKAERHGGERFVVHPGDTVTVDHLAGREIAPVSLRIVPDVPSVPTATRVSTQLESIEVLGVVEEGWDRVDVELRNARDVDLLCLQVDLGASSQLWGGTTEHPLAEGGATWVQHMPVSRAYLETDGGRFVIDPSSFPAIVIDYVEFIDGSSEGEMVGGEAASCRQLPGRPTREAAAGG